MVLALEYLAGRGVYPDDHRLNRSLPVILAKSRVDGCRELLTAVAGVTADQPAPAAAEASCQGSGRRFPGASLARNDVDHSGGTFRLELRGRRREDLDALNIARGNRLQVVAGLRSLELSRRLAVDQNEDVGVAAQRHDAIGVDIDRWNHIQKIAQRTERRLRVLRHAIDLAVDLRLDVKLLTVDDDGFQSRRGIVRRRS